MSSSSGRRTPPARRFPRTTCSLGCARDEGGTVSGSYAAEAAGLVERSAAAFIAAVPEQPADDGYFGPGSATWRAAGDLSAPVAGLRALLMQALHPLAMAGVDQHSDWRARPRRPALGGRPP